MDLYQQQIIDLAKHPIHRGENPRATLTHSGVNVTCGDHVRLYLTLEGSGVEAVFKEATWEGEGCAISVAAVCLLCDHLPAKTVKEVKLFDQKTMFDLLGIESLGPARVKCAVLCLETLHGALSLKLKQKE